MTRCLLPKRAYGRIPLSAGARALGTVAAVALLAWPGAAAAAPLTATTSFSSPGQYTFVVPAGVSSITVTAVGAAGGGGAGSPCFAVGGRGASYSGTFSVVAGQQLAVGVGGPGTAPAASRAVPGPVAAPPAGQESALAIATAAAVAARRW